MAQREAELDVVKKSLARTEILASKGLIAIHTRDDDSAVAQSAQAVYVAAHPISDYEELDRRMRSGGYPASSDADPGDTERTVSSEGKRIGFHRQSLCNPGHPAGVPPRQADPLCSDGDEQLSDADRTGGRPLRCADQRGVS